jgi:hypothetical protein
MSLLSDLSGWDLQHTQRLHRLEHPVQAAMFREMVRATLYNEMLQCTAMHNVCCLHCTMKCCNAQPCTVCAAYTVQ